MAPELVAMGYVANVFGVKGWVKVKTEASSSLMTCAKLYLKFPNGELIFKELEQSFSKEWFFYAKFVEINDRNNAFLLRGATVCAPRSDFPKLPTNEYYWVDLIGLSVINLNQEPLGEVINLMETGANDVLVVKEQKTERLIPFVKNYIINVDLVNKQIIVDWGLDY